MATAASRIIGTIFATTAIAMVAVWCVDGAPSVPNLEAVYDDASARGELRVALAFTGTAADASRTLTRLAEQGYPAVERPCRYLQQPDIHCVELRQHFTDPDAQAVAPKLGKELLNRWSLGYDVYDPKVDQIYRNFGDGDYSLAHGALFVLAQSETTGARAYLIVVAATVAAAALLGALILLRGAGTDALRWLGLGLAGSSLSIAYLWLFSVVPTFETWQLPGTPFRMAADVLAFGLLVASSYAYIRFWRLFPQPVSEQELEEFLDSLKREQLASTRQTWARYFTRRTVEPREESGSTVVRPIAKENRVSSRMALVAQALVGLVIMYVAMTWAVYPYEVADKAFNPTLISSLACFVLIVYWPGLTCLRIFRYHRSLGNAEDGRKIEWIWASIWMGFVAVVLPLVLLAVMLVGRYLFPGLEDGEHVAATLLVFGVSAGPLLVIAALAISILYRGTIDPRIALRGVTLFSLLGLILTLVFVFVERTIAVHLVKLWALPSQTGLVTAGALVAATFQPIRKLSEKYVTRFVERVLPASVLASGQRHTLAVAVVDISGYTALSAKDEQAALLASTLVQKESRRLADMHGGRVVKSTGDGVIMCFAEAQKALDAVRELHHSMDKAGVAMHIPDLHLHSGLHWGEVVEMHDGDIYGMTVNLAARIADWARAGEIGVSRAFHDQLESTSAGFQDAGPQTFKNVPEPVGCLRLSIA